MKGVEPNGKIGFTCTSNNFERGEGWLNFRDAANVTVDDIWPVLEKKSNPILKD